MQVDLTFLKRRTRGKLGADHRQIGAKHPLNHPSEGYDLAVSYIGLFGTCGTTTWRRDFIQTFEDLAIAYYNPQVAEWDPGIGKTGSAASCQ